MTTNQILDLQLTNKYYYWCKLKGMSHKIILQYFKDNHFEMIDFYESGSEEPISYKDIESINPNQIIEQYK